MAFFTECICHQGVLAEMDGHIQHLQKQLNSREVLVEALSTNISELTTKMEHLEASNRSAEHKIGTANPGPEPPLKANGHTHWSHPL